MVACAVAALFNDHLISSAENQDFFILAHLWNFFFNSLMDPIIASLSNLALKPKEDGPQALLPDVIFDRVDTRAKKNFPVVFVLFLAAYELFSRPLDPCLTSFIRGE